jgi:virginiamycin B lyase
VTKYGRVVRRLFCLLASTAAALGSVCGVAQAASCPGLTATSDVFRQESGVWLENMGFDGFGGMWVSELTANQLVRFDPHGKPGRTLSVAMPGASLVGPDGLMYVAFGDGVAGVAPGVTPAGVVRFDPRAVQPVAQPFAQGLPMANGAAFDRDGNLYVADTITPGKGLIKLRPDGTRDASFTAAVPVSGADGIAIIGSTLYVTLFSDSASRIIRVPLDAPATYTTLVELSPGGAPLKGPDDLTVGPDGHLWVATNVGELIRVDPGTGANCTVYSRAAPIDSVRFAHAFSPFQDGSDLFLTNQLGELTHLRVTGITPAPAAPAAPAAQSRPRMRVTASPRGLRRGHLTRVRVIVRSPAARCRGGVSVRFGTSVVHTNARGRAVLRVRSRSTGRRTVRATKMGCATGTTQITVRR